MVVWNDSKSLGIETRLLLEWVGIMKSRKKVIFWCSVSLLVISCFSGCKLVRDVDTGKVKIATPTPTEELKQPVNPTGTISPTQSPMVTMEPTKNPVTIVVENGPVLNCKEIINYFYDEDKETLLEEGYLKENWYGEHMLEYSCDKGGVILRYINAYNLDAGDSNNFFTISDMRYGGAANAYEPMCELGYIGEYQFSKNFPEIDLESCSRAEAIANTIRYLGIESLEDITITGISMVYCSEYEKWSLYVPAVHLE